MNRRWIGSCVFVAGATIIDGIDTLYIMGLQGEYDDARSWIEQSFDMKSDVSHLMIIYQNNVFS